MKNIYPRDLLELAYGKYQNLKKDERYKFRYWVLTELKKNCDSYSGKDRTIKDKLIGTIADWWIRIIREWDLRSPINPNLKLKKENLYKSIRPNSPLAKLIWAFGISADSRLLTPQKPKKTVSKRTRELDKRTKKFLCYTLWKETGISYRSLGRRFKADKETIANWIEEVNNWPEDERKAVMYECSRSKRLPDIDVLDLPGQDLTPLSKVEHKLTAGGIYQAGRKLKPKISY